MLRQGATTKARRPAGWLETVLHHYAARILPLDIDATRTLGRMSDQARAQGTSPGLADLAVAANDPFDTLPKP